MIAVQRLHLRACAPDAQGLRALVVVAEVHASEPTAGAAQLSMQLELLDATDALVAEVELPPRPIGPEQTLLTWTHSRRLPAPVARCRWRARATQTWATPVLAAPAAGGAAASADVASPVPAPPRPEARRAVGPQPMQTPGVWTPTAAPAAPRQSAPARAPAPAPAPAAQATFRARFAQPPPDPRAGRFHRLLHEPWSAVEELFPPDSLDPDGRDVVRSLIKSEDPAEIVAGLQVARSTRWKTTVQYMRALVRHASPEVRASAATGIGALAGPAMEMLLRGLVDGDPVAEVRSAAQAALADMASRARR